MELDRSIVERICNSHQIEVHDLSSVTGSFNKPIFFINQAYLLRVSQRSMVSEQESFMRIAALKFVPKIRHTGILEREDGPLHYTLLTLLPGDDFVNVYAATSPAQQEQLGVQVATFLDGLHQITGARYDIGLYVPILPDYSGTWRAGHQEYWEILNQGAAQIELKPESRHVFERAFAYLRSSGPALDFQSGPKLLHNDFHPKNLLLDQGCFSGVIDWECSQFGEADFELCHLIHWCLYPPSPTIDFRPFLRAMLAAKPLCAQVPHLAQRLTIYQIEHEIQQILWSAGAAESWRVPRLIHWLDGAVEQLLKKLS